MAGDGREVRRDGITAGMPSRRAVVRAGSAGASAGVAAMVASMLASMLAACGIRVELPAPTPGPPDRVPMPDEEAIVAAALRAQALAGLAHAVGDEPVATRHTAQAQVWAELLAAGGAPRPTATTTVSTSTALATPATATTATSASATGTSDSSAPASAGAPTTPPGPVRLGAAEAELPDPHSVRTHRDLHVAALAHDASTAALLGVAPQWPPADPLPPAAAVSLLGPTRAARYAVQVAAAHRPAIDRAPDLALDAALERRERALVAVAGSAAPAAPLGYTLPFAVRSPGDADRLVRTVLDSLVASGLDPLDALPPGSTTLLAVARLHAEAVTLAAGRGIAPAPFPGLVGR
jgi:hypothetical protein